MQQKWMIGTFVLWLLSTVFSAVHRIATHSSFPRPSDDYEKQWDFQLTMFMFLEFPFRLVGLGIALGILFLIFRRRRTKDRIVEGP